MDGFTLQQEDGEILQLGARPLRIVSLVPSITENLILFGVTPVGRTSFCVEPKNRVEGIPVVGGTKTPKISRIIELQPDLVIANKEENVKEHVEALEKEGIPVWTTYPVTVDDTLLLMKNLEKVCGSSSFSRTIISDASAELSSPYKNNSVPSFTFAALIWKDPWMAAGKDTYINSMLEYIGGKNIFIGSSSRYQEIDIADVAKESPDLVLLPSEPYAFQQEHVEELKVYSPNSFIALFCGEDLCWPGPRMLQTLNELKKIKQEFL